MRGKKLLLIGYGDIASRSAALFRESGISVTAIARTAKPLIGGTFWQGAVADTTVLEKLTENRFDIAIVTLTPGERGDEAYRQAYVENSRRLIDCWRGTGNAPDLVIFVSSTSVYAQDNGEWVDETSTTEPAGFAGRRLLEAERLWQASGIYTCVVRFSGIYGPGRHHLIDQVKAGRVGGEGFTNRIHADDCAGVLAHLCRQHFMGGVVPDVLLATDCEPAPGWQVSQWLARQLNMASSGESAANGRGGKSGNKRCSNKRLLMTGYIFKYPSYREGYRAILAGSLKTNSDSLGE